MTRCWHTLRSSYSWGSTILQSLRFMSSRDKLSIYISTYTRTMATKHIKSYEATWHIKNIISALSKCLLSTNLSGWWHTARNSQPKFWITKNFAWHFNEVVLQGHITNKIHYISTLRRPIDRTLGKVLHYLEILLPLKSHYPLITWVMQGHVEIWNIYIFTFPRDMATKLHRVLALRRRFNTQTLKSSPISYLKTILAQLKSFCESLITHMLKLYYSKNWKYYLDQYIKSFTGF